MTKYGAQRSGGFHSKKEHARALMLRLLQQAGNITDLQMQVHIPLYGRDGPLLTPTGRHKRYIADFTYTENGKPVVEDVKGYRTPEYLLIKSILAAQGVHIRET